MTAARTIYTVLANAGESRFREHLRLDIKPVSAAAPAAAGKKVASTAPLFPSIGVEFRETLSSPWVPLFVVTEEEKAVGNTQLNWQGTVSYQLAIQNVRNPRKYFPEGGEPIQPAPEDVSVTVEAYKLLDAYLRVLINDAIAEKKIGKRGTPLPPNAVAFQSLEYQPVVRTCTTAGVMMQNPMMYLKLKEPPTPPPKPGSTAPPQEPTLVRRDKFKDETQGGGFPILTKDNVDDACKGCNFLAVISSKGITGTAAGLFLNMYINELCIRRVNRAGTTSLTFGGAPPAFTAPDDYQDAYTE